MFEHKAFWATVCSSWNERENEKDSQSNGEIPHFNGFSNQNLSPLFSRCLIDKVRSVSQLKFNSLRPSPATLLINWIERIEKEEIFRRLKWAPSIGKAYIWILLWKKVLILSPDGVSTKCNHNNLESGQYWMLETIEAKVLTI